MGPSYIEWVIKGGAHWQPLAAMKFDYSDTRRAIDGYYNSGRDPYWTREVRGAFLRESRVPNIEGLEHMTMSFILWLLDGGKRLNSTRPALLELLERNKKL